MTAALQLDLYGAAVFVMLALTWASGGHVAQKLALLLMTAWAVSNVALAAFGYRGEPLVVPSLDAAVAVAVALVGYKHRSWLAAVVFGLFAVLAVVHVVAFAGHRQETYAYYGLKNLIFILQVVSVGGVGAVGAWANRDRMVAWLFRRHQRPRAHSPRGA